MKIMNIKPYKFLKTIGNNEPCTLKNIMKDNKHSYCYTGTFNKAKEFVKLGLLTEKKATNKNRKTSKKTNAYSLTPKGKWMLQILNKLNKVITR